MQAAPATKLLKKSMVIVVHCHTCCLQAIDLIDEAGSRVRIAAYNARKGAASKEDPKVDEYLQVGLGLCGAGSGCV